MAGSYASSKRPAVWIGGERRRLARRSGLPRSNTAPMLGPDSQTASLVSSPATGLGTSPHASEESSMSFYPMGNANVKRAGGSTRGIHRAAASPMASPMPSPAVTSTVSPALMSPRSQGPHTPVSPYPYVPAIVSPTTTRASASTAATEGRKKPGLFDGSKSRERDWPGSSQNSPMMPMVISPLPPTTPSKAAQFLGLEVDVLTRGSANPYGNPFLDDVVVESRPVRPTLRPRASAPLLTMFKDVSSRLPKFREEHMESDAPKTKKTWGGSSKKAMRVLGNLPSFGPSSKRTANQNRAAASPRSAEDDMELGYSSDSDLHTRSQQVSQASRPIQSAPRRRRRKRGPKSLDRMSPITEASFDELRTVYCHEEEDGTELEVISEYEHDYPPRSASMLPRSHTESFLNMPNAYELEDYDLSPTDNVIEEEPEEEQQFNVHPGTKVDLSHMEWQQPANLQLRSPLQAVEDRLLDAAEEDMRHEASLSFVSKSDAAQLQLDTENAALKEQHEKMKKNFALLVKLQDSAQDQPDAGIEDEGSNDDMVSICSSIDLDEEPVVHTAQVMTFTRIPPGTVKLVDIPARKKKVLPVDPNTSGKANDIVSVQTNRKKSEHEDFQVGPSSTLQQHIKLTKPQPEISRSYSAHYDRAVREKKAKMPRDESRVLVHEWIHTQDPGEQRPLSERIDHDVLADQQIPPAPFPKENCPLPSPPMKRPPIPTPSSKQLPKHTCLNNGHIFHPVDLNQVPDRAAINSLEVRPYLHTHHGVKQHVHVPVFCNRCGEDVKTEMWECEIAVCRMTVCRACAEDMEEEWQERAVGSWRH